MCTMNKGYSASGIYFMDTGYPANVSMYNRNIAGMYICNRITVQDMSGMISYRIDCRPVSSTSSPFRIMY